MIFMPTLAFYSYMDTVMPTPLASSLVGIQLCLLWLSSLISTVMPTLASNPCTDIVIPFYGCSSAYIGFLGMGAVITNLTSKPLYWCSYT